MTAVNEARRAEAMIARIDELETEVKRLRRLSEARPLFATPVVGRLAEAAAAEFGVSPGAIFGPQRAAPIALARQVVMYLAATSHHRSQPQIGRALARDHSTVCHGIQRVAALLRGEPDFAARVQRVASAAHPQPEKPA